MVQMRRQNLFRTKSFSPNQCNHNSFFGFLGVIVLTSMIPVLFVVRYVILYSNHSTSMIPMMEFPPSHLPLELQDVLVFLRQSASASASQPQQKGLATFTYGDVVELSHCRLQDMTLQDWTNFSMTSLIWIPELVQSLNASSDSLVLSNPALADMEREFALELLEQYVTDRGYCDFSRYRPTVTNETTSGMIAAGNRLKIQETMHAPPEHQSRLLFVIIAFHDLEHLKALVDAIHLPQHFIILHLERRTDPVFSAAVWNLARTYDDNVVVLQFGTVAYKSDSVSLINLRILRWATVELNLNYDFCFLMDGNAYPLVSPSDLAEHMWNSNGRHVWLGRLLHKGQEVPEEPDDTKLRQKRLLFTVKNHPKLIKRLPRSYLSKPLPDSLRQHFSYKSTSGNQGIYSKRVIEALLDNDDVMEIFARSKYGCCCCLEEINWIAALHVIGYGPEALEQASMYQAWGGQPDRPCESSMGNAVMTQDATICYKSEDPNDMHRYNKMYFYGNETWTRLEHAQQQQGYLFARKFSSDNAASILLREEIEHHLWN